jgi:hypothetical protein
VGHQVTTCGTAAPPEEALTPLASRERLALTGARAAGDSWGVLARATGTSLRSALVAACVVMLIGHVCMPLEMPSEAVTLASASMAQAPGDAAHAASCEDPPVASVMPAPSLAVSHPPAFNVLAPENRDTRDAPVPVSRPPRFLLFASLLN